MFRKRHGEAGKTQKNRNFGMGFPTTIIFYNKDISLSGTGLVD